MQLSSTSLALLLLQSPGARAFSSHSSKQNVNIIGHKISSFHQIARLSTTTALPSSKDDDGDDWFDGYDDFVEKIDFNAPSKIESNRGGRSSGGGENRRGGGGGGESYGGGGSSRSNSGRGSSHYNSGGHDYERDASDTGSVDEGAVNELLASRLYYRKSQDYDAADGIRDELLNVHGVTVWDKDLTWTTKSAGYVARGRGGGGGRGGRGGGRGDRDGGRGGRGGRGAGRGEDRMNEHGHDYSFTGGPIESTLTESEINTLIKERLECKFARDYQSADQIQEELLNTGVDIHDGFKEWRADGEQWERSKRKNGPASDGGSWGPKVYHQRGPGKGLSEEQVETISAMVAERSEAKSVRDYNRADGIFEELADKYSVNVDDRNEEWALYDEEMMLGSNTPFVPDEEVQKTVGKKLGERILARKNRDFDLADDIRDELTDMFFVEIDDRSKEWTMAAPAVTGQSSSSWDEEDGDEEDVEDDLTEDDTTEEEEESSITEEENNASSSLDVSVLSSMTVPQLKEKLREAGLPVSGRKSELIDRLSK